MRASSENKSGFSNKASADITAAQEVADKHRKASRLAESRKWWLSVAGSYIRSYDRFLKPEVMER